MSTTACSRSTDPPVAFPVRQRERQRLIVVDHQGPERDYTKNEEDSVIHYAPGDHPLCGTESLTAVFTDDPALVAGCVDCLELAAEDLVEDNEHWANCVHCQQEISAQNGVEWRRVVRAPCPHCGKPGW